MLEKVRFPKGFTRGAPTEPGCYVLIIRDGASYVLEVHDVGYVSEEHCGDLDVKPGFVMYHQEDFFYAENLEERGVVGYKKLDGVSAFDLWTHRGELEYEAGAKATR